jgi:hypothetical protein
VKPAPFPKLKCNTTHDIVSDAIKEDVTLLSFCLPNSRRDVIDDAKPQRRLRLWCNITFFIIIGAVIFNWLATNMKFAGVNIYGHPNI